MTEASQRAIALMALMRLKGVGRRGALRLLAGAPAETPDLRAQVEERAERARLPLEELSEAWRAAEARCAESLAGGITPVPLGHQTYPKRLAEISDPPAVLFVKGSHAGLKADRAIAVVGTREPTPFGARVARRSAEAAANAGFVIVSGLAHGCDTLGHEGCLDANGVGVAVMAHGLDRVYPAANRDLADRLLAGGGCLVSEYPIGMTPARTAFAERDRIQSGLSDAVLVIETDVKGGTMHTVRFAREQRRGLACIDHPEKWRSEEKTRGNQRLIADRWATPIPDGEALAVYLTQLQPSAGGQKPSSPPQSTETQAVWDF